MDPRRRNSARRWSAVASLVLVAGAVLVAVITSGAAQARAQAAPSNTSPPTITGVIVVGQTLTANSGTWSGDPTPTFTYQWLRCDSAGGSCGAVSGQTGVTYVLTSADAGRTLRVAVTATNTDGSAQATSGQTGVIMTTGAPSNTSDPVISGTIVQGQTLTVTSGGWTGSAPITFAYQWVRCGTDGGAPDGSNCPAIPGATGQSYKLVSDDVGHRLRVRVTGTNGAGSATATSNPTGIILGSTSVGPPKNTKEPAISGVIQQGKSLTVSGAAGTEPSRSRWRISGCAAALTVAGRTRRTAQPSVARRPRSTS